jgi:hypothetical protein
MGTELTPTGLGVSINTELFGRPQDNGLYTQSLEQKWHYGLKKIITANGRLFKYARAKTALSAGYLSANIFPVSKHVTYAVLPVAIAVGDLTAKITVATTLGYANTGFAQDELVGGTLVVGHNTTSVENRVIVANSATPTAGAVMTVTVDGAFNTANSTSNGAEAYPNPYAYLGQGNYDFNAFMGVPAINTTILYSSFIQTYGPCWIVPGGSTSSNAGIIAGDRTAFAVGDGTVNDYSSLTTAASSYYRQRVGFFLDTTSAGAAAMPNVQLQIAAW